MIIKHSIIPGVDENGEPLLHLIEPGEMVKTASALMPEVEDFICGLRPDPKYTYVLVNAMGYSEYYGANSNKDWYGYNHHLNHNGLIHAPEDWGRDPQLDKERAKHWPYGYPTYYNASVYAHHKNSDPEKFGFGDIIFVAPNHRMKRIELVKRIDNSEIVRKGRSSILDRIRHGERVDVSMGCKVPFDFCSICTDWDEVLRAWETFDASKHVHPGIAIVRYHKSVKPIRGLSITKADYCEHMRTMGGQILPDGRKVFVYNDFPRFFDNSFVWIGADKTARVMWFMTSDQVHDPDPKPKVSHDLSRRDIQYAMEKTAQASIKKSEIEKEVPDAYVKEIRTHSLGEPEIDIDVLDHAADSIGPKALLSTLASLGIVAKPEEFQRIVLISMPGGKEIAHEAEKKSALFDTETPAIDDSFGVNAQCVDPVFQNALSSYVPFRSSLSPHLDRRLEEPVGPVKTASYIDTPLFYKLASQYNGYRISLLEKCGEELLSPEYIRSDADSLIKSASSGWAPLLLGLGPMIHLISSHFRKEEASGKDLGTVSKFVSDNPSFTSAMTIGAGLRAAMGINKAGGIGAALKNVAKIVT